MQRPMTQGQPTDPSENPPGPLRAWLITTLEKLAPGFEGPIEDETPLAGDGLCLDSLSLFALIAALEDHTGVAIREAEIHEEHFGTVGRLLGFLAVCQTPAHGVDLTSN